MLASLAFRQVFRKGAPQQVKNRSRGFGLVHGFLAGFRGQEGAYSASACRFAPSASVLLWASPSS